MREIERKVNDRNSMIYGYTVMWTNTPEYPEILWFVNVRRRVVYINKGAREGASVVSLSFS